MNFIEMKMDELNEKIKLHDEDLEIVKRHEHIDTLLVDGLN